jgi:plasmid replication initiation protein
MKEKIKSKDLVVKGNDLVEARYNLQLSQIKLILYLTTMIGKDDEEFKEYEIPIKDFASRTGKSIDYLYSYAKKITEDLLKRILKIPYLNKDGKKIFLQVAWLSHAKYIEGEGNVRISFDPELKPYLLQQKERFTHYDIENIIPMRSKYSIRLYELLKQYQGIGYREFKINELKEILGIKGKYAVYTIFREKVILKAQEELKKYSDIWFDFKERKAKGHAFTHIKFTIHPQKSQAILEKEKVTQEPGEVNNIIIEKLEEAYQKYRANRINIFLNNPASRTMEINLKRFMADDDFRKRFTGMTTEEFNKEIKKDDDFTEKVKGMTEEDFIKEFEGSEFFPEGKTLLEKYKETGINSLFFRPRYYQFIEINFIGLPLTFEEFSKQAGYVIEKKEDGKYHIIGGKQMEINWLEGGKVEL